MENSNSEGVGQMPIETYVEGLPQVSNEEERLRWCEVCTKAKRHRSKSVLCGITDTKPMFLKACSEFKADADRIQRKIDQANGGTGVYITDLPPRGILGIYILLNIIASFAIMLFFFIGSMRQPQFFLVAGAALVVGTGFLLMYRWKRDGVYIVFIVGAIQGVLSLLFVDNGSGASLVGLILALVLLGVLLAPKWKHFH